MGRGSICTRDGCCVSRAFHSKPLRQTDLSHTVRFYQIFSDGLYHPALLLSHIAINLYFICLAFCLDLAPKFRLCHPHVQLFSNHSGDTHSTLTWHVDANMIGYIYNTILSSYNDPRLSSFHLVYLAAFFLFVILSLACLNDDTSLRNKIVRCITHPPCTVLNQRQAG
jgi:hypothetical protein